MGPIRVFALAALLAAAACPMRAGAQRDCCYGGHSPPIFDGARLAAGSVHEAVERAERLGFTWSDTPRDVEGPLGFVHFRRGGIVWANVAGMDYVGLSALSLQPLVSSRPYLICYPMPAFKPLYSDARSEHPNTAIGIVGVIGLVGDLDGFADYIEDEDAWAFGRETFETDLGGRAREMVFAGGGFVRLVAPAAADAPCAAWLQAEPGRWIGVVIECESLAAAAAWFDAHGVHYHRVHRHEIALLVDPQESGGVMFEFVLKGWRPQV